VKDREAGHEITRKNEELERLFRKENILSVIRKLRLQNHLIRMIVDENPVGKRPIEAGR